MSDESLTLDELMSLDPLSMTKDHISAIIQYHRNARASAAERAAAGPRGKRSAKSLLDKAPSAKLDLKALGLVKTPDAPKITRRV